MRTLLRLSRRLLFREAQGRRAPSALRGLLRTAVVVKDPGAQFSEAVFVLRDDAAKPKGLTRAELLEQARAAAAGYLEESLPPPPAPMLRPLAAFLLGAAATLLVLWVLGVL